MMYLYKDKTGQIVYSDRPPSAGEASSSLDVIKNGVVVKTEPAKQDDPHAQAKG